jgi:hypothetical protein
MLLLLPYTAYLMSLVFGFGCLLFGGIRNEKERRERKKKRPDTSMYDTIDCQERSHRYVGR